VTKDGGRSGLLIPRRIQAGEEPVIDFEELVGVADDFICAVEQTCQPIDPAFGGRC